MVFSVLLQSVGNGFNEFLGAQHRRILYGRNARQVARHSPRFYRVKRSTFQSLRICHKIIEPVKFTAFSQCTAPGEYRGDGIR